jgi:hypothetical protein
VLIGGGALQLPWAIYIGWDATTGVLATVVAAGFVLLGVAQLRSRLEVDPEQTVIVNGFVRHTLSNDEIASITADRYRILPRAVVVRAKDGSRLGVWAMPGINPSW